MTAHFAASLLLLALVAPVPSGLAPVALVASGGLTPNADGTTSFEFRLENQQADVAVTGVMVTVTFFDGKPDAASRLAEYHWSFAGPVPPKGMLLEYGKLTAPQTADLVARYAKVVPGFSREQLEFVTYSYIAKVDAVATRP